MTDKIVNMNKTSMVVFFVSKGLVKQKKYIETVLLKLLSEEGVKNARIDCHVLDTVSMKRVNKLLRGKNQSTNVISTPFTLFRAGDSRSTRLGELYLCPSYIKAKKESLLTMVIHGFLHIVGYTHEDSRDTLFMQEREEELSRLF